MRRSGIIVAVGAVVFVVAALTVTAVVLLRPGGPPREAGLAWTDEIVSLVLGRELGEGTLDEVRASLPGSTVDEATPGSCKRELEVPRSGYVSWFRIGFETGPGRPCNDVRASSVWIDFRKSEGVNPATVFETLRKRLGPPVMSTEREGNKFSLKYDWHPQQAMSVTFTTSYDLKSGDGMRLSVSRERGAVMGMMTQAEEGAWLDGYIALITGPAFSAGHGAGDAARLGAVQESEAADGQCGISRSDFPATSPFLSVVSLERVVPAGGATAAACDGAPFRELWATVFSAGSVTVARANARLRDRLGAPLLEPYTGVGPRRWQWKRADGFGFTLLDETEGGLAPLFQIKVVRER